jgi:hypothetical protein
VAHELQQVLGDRGFERLVDAIGHAHRGVVSSEADVSGTPPSPAVDSPEST